MRTRYLDACSYSATLLVIALVMPTGCSDKALQQKDYDPPAIAAAVLTAFDTDDDGKLDEDELLACPPLQSAQDRIDTNQDGAVDASEISNRVESYATMSEYIVAEVFVKRGRRPVAGAEVTLVLAEYMNSIPTKFVATTNVSGTGMPVSSPEELLGFPPGLYDVEVKHEGEIWNLGVEVADDNPSVSRLVFDLDEK